MARPKTVSLKTLGGWPGSWNPLVKLAYVGLDGRRHWQVTRLAAAVYNAKQVKAKGLSPELSVQHNGYQYTITGWEE